MYIDLRCIAYLVYYIPRPIALLNLCLLSLLDIYTYLLYVPCVTIATWLATYSLLFSLYCFLVCTVYSIFIACVYLLYVPIYSLLCLPSEFQQIRLILYTKIYSIKLILLSQTSVI